MALGDLLLKLGVDIAQFQGDLGKAVHLSQQNALAMQRAFDKVQNTLAGLGAGISVAALSAFVNKAIEGADRLNDLRTRTGATGQELITLEGAALRGGVQLEAISDVTSKLGKRLQEASTGSGDAANAFAALGIKVTKSNGDLKGINEILREAGAKFSGYEDGANKAALATAAFGKGGDKLIPVVEGIEETEKRFKRLGITISEDVLTAADKFKDTQADITSLNEAQARQMAANLLPTLQNLADRYVDLKKESTLLADAGRTLDFVLRGLFAGALIGVATFTALGKAIGAQGVVLGEFLSGNFVNAGKLGIQFGKEIATDFKAQFDIARQAFSGARREVDNFDLMGDTSKIGRRSAPRIVDLAKAGAEAKAAADALTKLQDELAKLGLDALKANGKREETLIGLQHAAGLLNDQEYFSQKIEIARKARDAEVKLLDEQIDRQRRDVSQAPKNTKDYYEAVGKLEKTLAARNELEAQFQQFGKVESFGQIKNAQAYRDAVEQLNTQLLELNDNTVEVAMRKFASSTRDAFLKFYLAEDQAALSTYQRVADGTKLQAQFNESKEEYGRIQDRLSIAEQRIQNDLKVGAITDLEALNRTSEARKSATSELDKQLVIFREIAQLSGNDKLKLQVEQMTVSVAKLKTESELLADKFNGVFSNEVSSALTDFVTGTKSASDAFRSFVNGVVRGISDIASKGLATSLFGGGAGGGVGGFLSGLFSGNGLTGPLQGPTPSGGNLSESAGLVGGIGSFLAKFIPSFDVGSAYVPRTGLAMVHQGERITKASENVGGFSRPIQQIFNISGPVDQRSQMQIQAAAGIGVQRALARNS
jgi:hypothetical protein